MADGGWPHPSVLGRPTPDRSGESFHVQTLFNGMAI